MRKKIRTISYEHIQLSSDAYLVVTYLSTSNSNLIVHLGEIYRTIALLTVSDRVSGLYMIFK